MKFPRHSKTTTAFAVAMGIASLGGPIHAQEDPGWKVTCVEVNRCTAVIAVKDASSEKSLAAIGIQISKGGKDPALVAFLPLGIELKPGFRAVVAGKVYDAAFEACFADGCRAIGPLPEGALEDWLAADTVQMQFFPYAADKPVAADIPLKGLREALESKSLLSAP